MGGKGGVLLRRTLGFRACQTLMSTLLAVSYAVLLLDGFFFRRQLPEITSSKRQQQQTTNTGRTRQTDTRTHHITGRPGVVYW